MVDSKKKRRVRLSAYLISPLPAALGMLGAEAAHAVVLPQANPDTFTVPYNSLAFAGGPLVIGNVLTNDTGNPPLLALVYANTFTLGSGFFTLDLATDGNVTMDPVVENVTCVGLTFPSSIALPYTMSESGFNAVSESTFTVDLVAPILPDMYTTNAGTSVSGDVRDNDLPTGDTLPVSQFFVAAHGTVQGDHSNAGTNGNFTYTPNAGFSGQDSFGYVVVDQGFECGSVSWNTIVQVTVLPVADPDSYSTPYQTSVNGNVLTNDLGSGLQVTGNTQPAHGSANVAGDGSFIYVPDPGFSGADTFQYTIMDNSGDQEPASALVTVDVGIRAVPAPATSPVALGLLGTLLAWLGLRRKRAR